MFRAKSLVLTIAFSTLISFTSSNNKDIQLTNNTTTMPTTTLGFFSFGTNYEVVKSFDDEMLDEVVTLVNDLRKADKKSTLKLSNRLKRSADIRSEEISRKFSHTRPDGTHWSLLDKDVYIGENLAFGYSTAKDVVDAWMASPSHKDNILYKDFKYIAVSYYVKEGVYYWSLAFG